MAVMARLPLFATLAHRAFALRWGGETISCLGDGIHIVAIAWWVVATTGSASAMGGVLVATTLPELALLLAGGVAVDRLPRLAVLLAADVLRGGLMGILALLAWRGYLTLWHVLVAGILFGGASAVVYPAATAVMPELLPAPLLPSGNALRGLSLRLGGIVGPALGGILIARGGSALAFALDGVSFAASALCLAAAVRHATLPRSRARYAGLRGELSAGFAEVTGSAWLWLTIAIAGVSNVTLAGPFYAALPLLVEYDLGGNAGTLGVLNALVAAGAVGTTLMLGHGHRLRRRGWLIYGYWLIAALAAATLGVTTSLLGVGLALIVYGAAEAGLGLIWTNVLQDYVPGDRLGRVASIDALGSAALLPLGFSAAGLAADQVGPSPVFAMGGIVSAGVVALGLLHPAVRNLD